MGLLGAARTNIKRSLYYYFKNNLETTEGLSIDWGEGLPFDNTSKTEWIQPRIIDSISDYSRQGSSTQYGNNLDVMFNINIFIKKSNIVKSGREYAIRDIVAKYFKVGEVITIYDYSGDGSSDIGSMKVRDIITDDIISETNILYMYNLTYLINATTLTTNP